MFELRASPVSCPIRERGLDTVSASCRAVRCLHYGAALSSRCPGHGIFTTVQEKMVQKKVTETVTSFQIMGFGIIGLTGDMDRLCGFDKRQPISHMLCDRTDNKNTDNDVQSGDLELLNDDNLSFWSRNPTLPLPPLYTCPPPPQPTPHSQYRTSSNTELRRNKWQGLGTKIIILKLYLHYEDVLLNGGDLGRYLMDQREICF